MKILLYNMNKEKTKKETLKMEKDKQELFSVVFATEKEDRTESKTQELAENISGARGIACFTRPETQEKYWGVLVGRQEKDKKENV